MREVELSAPEGWDDASIIALVEEAGAAHGLTFTRGSLASYPGCTHWHFKQPGVSGTLDATWWPKKRRLWLKVHPRREAAWVDPAIEALRHAFP